MSKNFTRRDFLKVGAGALTLTTMSALSGCSSNEATSSSSSSDTSGVTYNMPESWDYTTDLVVVGTGTTMYGAIKAVKSGLSVIALEAYSSPGGATGFSGGAAWLPLNRFSIEQGDTKEACMTYLRKIAREIPIEDKVLEAYVDNSNPMFEFMESHFKDYGIVGNSGGKNGFGDYHAEWKGGRADAYRTIGWRKSDGAMDVAAWKDAYTKGFEEIGGKILLSTKATKYVYKYDEMGVPVVLGLIAEQDGKEISIQANKGVLVGAGGFEWNEKVRNSFLAVETPYACSLPTNDGTMLLSTMGLGADLINMSECFGMLTFREKADEQKKNGQPCNIIFERWFPRQIIVNKYGRRFMNESVSYDDAWLPFATYDTSGQNEKINVPAWQIFDRKFVDETGFKKSYFIGAVDKRGVPPYFKEANSLEELADIIKVDKKGLVEEVAKWNEFCKAEKDLDFHRGENYMDQMFARMRDMSLPLMHNLGPIDTAPYYAAEIAPNTLGTNGGPKINENAQVMHVSGVPIPNLYACGNFAGFGGPGRGYPGAGGTVGPGQVMGFVAVNHIIG
ncbi:FAD-binding protein [Desulfitobacterium sp. THU1]|uniref:FAD-dependent oxidoreductase n=1 Tax=Desulfitobacterium sp. THU1 TaxID=3138072 RepID=UPI00311DD81C